MGRDWETQLQDWARPPGKTEQDKMERAEREIGIAIANDPKLRAPASRRIVVSAPASTATIASARPGTVPSPGTKMPPGKA